MDGNLYSVKTRAYHHGGLRQALIDAALDVLVDKGVDGFSLRETARRAGVSPGAPKHHFADSRALLTAIATDAFTELGDQLEQAATDAEGCTRDRIAAQAEAYIGFALANRARFDLMWRNALLDQGDRALNVAGDRAFATLDRLIRGDGAPELPRTAPAMTSTMACWGLAHGLACLALEGALGSEQDIVEQAKLLSKRAIELVM